MAKEKKRLIDSKENETTLFYYEIIGSLAIIFAITVLGKLGTLGNIFTIFFKVCFGDWYFLLVLFVLFFGVYCLFMHQKFNFISHRFIGFVFIITSILTFSHFPVHTFIESNEGNYFSLSWHIYKSYINTGISSSLGGGMVGAIIFYSMFYLLGKLGVVLLGVILLFLGASLLFNRSIKDMSNFIFNRLVNFRKHLKGFNNFFKYEVGKEIGKTNYIKNSKLPLKLLNNLNNPNILVKQEEEKISLNKKIKEILYSLDVNYVELNKVVSYYVVTLSYEIYTSIDYLVIFKEIKSKIKEEIFFSVEDNIISLQIALNNKRIYSLKESFDLQDNELSYILGISYLNNLVTIDLNTNLLLIGSKYSGIRNIITSILFQSLFKKSINNYEYYLYDNLNSIEELTYLFAEVEEDIFVFLDSIKTLIERRIDELNKLNIASYQEYLKKVESNETYTKIKKVFVFINEVNNLFDKYNVFESKLLYILSLSKKAGVSIIYIVRKSLNLNNVIYSVFESKLIFKSDKELISSLINYDKNNPVLKNSMFLEGFGDCYYVIKNEYTRLLPPKISRMDIDSINNYLKK